MESAHLIDNSNLTVDDLKMGDRKHIKQESISTLVRNFKDTIRSVLATTQQSRQSNINSGTSYTSNRKRETASNRAVFQNPPPTTNRERPETNNSRREQSVTTPINENILSSTNRGPPMRMHNVLPLQNSHVPDMATYQHQYAQPSSNGFIPAQRDSSGGTNSQQRDNFSGLVDVLRGFVTQISPFVR